MNCVKKLVRDAFIAGAYAGFSVTREGFNAEWDQVTCTDFTPGDRNPAHNQDMVKFVASAADEYCCFNEQGETAMPGLRWVCKRCEHLLRYLECSHCGNREKITDEKSASGIGR